MHRARYTTPLVFSVGLALSFISAYVVQQRHLDLIRADFESDAANRVLSLQRSIDTSIVVGRSIVALFQSSQQVDRTEFATFVTGVFTNTPFIKAFEWVPRLSAAQRLAYEAQAASHYPDFRITERSEAGELIARTQQSEYFPVFYLEPYSGNENALGFDLGSNAARRSVLNRARESGMPTTTGRISLVQGGPGDWGFLMCFPMYAHDRVISTVDQRKLNLTGFTVLVFDIAELVDSSLKHLTPAELQLAIYDENAAGDEQQLYFRQPPTHLTSSLHAFNLFSTAQFSYASSIRVNDRNWRIDISPLPGHYIATIDVASILIFCGGIFGTALFTAYLTLMRQRAQDIAQTNIRLERAVQERTQELEQRNEELETYSYSIAHDLRTPLRTITGFSQILAEDARDRLDQAEQDHLQRIVSAGKHMAELIDDILQLSRITHQNMERVEVDLTGIARSVADRISNLPDQEHPATWHIQEGMTASGDESLLHVLLENLLVNAWKFSSKQANPVIEFSKSTRDGIDIYRIHDNGIGFDPQYADTIFGVFQRLHDKSVFDGTGIGLATAQRIVARHGGRIWAEGVEGGGATFYFTLQTSRQVA